MAVAQRQTPLLNDADYFNSSAAEPWELLDGVAYAMAPAPLLIHQSISGCVSAWLFNRMAERCGGGEPPTCRVFTAPVDVRLNAYSVVQPDVIVVCDPRKLANGRYVDGAPDLVIEILSAATAKHDRLTKRLAYQHAGVPEYLIIDPHAQTIEQFCLDSLGVYPAPNVFAPGDQLSLRLWPTVSLAVADWFPSG